MTSLLTVCISVRFHDSLSDNKLTNYGRDMSGIIQLAEALKTNEGLTSLKYARLPRTFPIWQVSAALVSACFLLIPLTVNIRPHPRHHAAASAGSR